MIILENLSELQSHTAPAVQHLIKRITCSRSRWRCALKVDGLILYSYRPDETVEPLSLLSLASGAVIGTLFSKSNNGIDVARVTGLSAKEEESILRSSGRRLVTNYWGHYVAVIKDAKSSKYYVLRDPSGSIPCYVTDLGGVTVITSDLDYLLVSSRQSISINWEHIATFLWFDRLVTEDCGLNDVSQVRAGECLTIHQQRIDRTFYWDPAAIMSEPEMIEDPDVAARELRQTVQMCVNAWSSEYNYILHELSGGLDSSIVLSCLASAPSRSEVLCYNAYTDTPEGDERYFARLAVQDTDYTLVEKPLRRTSSTLSNLLDCRRVATPVLVSITSEAEIVKEEVARTFGAQAVFSGQGGDHLFQRRRNNLIAAEYAHRHGITPGLLRVASETSQLTRKSIWSVLAAIFRYGLMKLSMDPYSRYYLPEQLNDEIRNQLTVDVVRHPWLATTTQLPASKRQQIFDVIDCQLLSSRNVNYADVVHPLISQPIIETCLRIPTYVLSCGGIERALARKAFRAHVPEEILLRTTKGETTGNLNRLILNNKDFVREFLLDGHLSNEGLINRKALEKSLSDHDLLRGDSLRFILISLRAEKWVRNWLNAPTW